MDVEVKGETTLIGRGVENLRRGKGEITGGDTEGEWKNRERQEEKTTHTIL